MAHLTLNVAFRELHGRMGGLVYVHRYGKQYVRIYARPSNPNTPAQRRGRNAFGEAVRAWQALTAEEKESWNDRARRKRRSGYNMFISEWMKADEGAERADLYPAPGRIPSVNSQAFRVSSSGAPLPSSSDTAPFPRIGSLYPAPAPRISPPR